MRFAAGATLLFAVLAAIAGAQEVPQGTSAPEPVPAAVSLAVLLAEMGQTSLDELTADEVSSAIGLASVASQQRAHVARSVRLSWIAPGLGHYVNGATGTAAAFGAAEVAVGLATAVLAYWLLPQAVQHRNLNYLQSSYSVIEERWKTLSPAQLIPSFAVAVSGSILRLTVRNLAASSAREVAMQALRDGTVRFEPHPLESIGW